MISPYALSKPPRHTIYGAVRDRLVPAEGNIARRPSRSLSFQRALTSPSTGGTVPLIPVPSCSSLFRRHSFSICQYLIEVEVSFEELGSLKQLRHLSEEDFVPEYSHFSCLPFLSLWLLVRDLLPPNTANHHSKRSWPDF